MPASPKRSSFTKQRTQRSSSLSKAFDRTKVASTKDASAINSMAINSIGTIPVNDPNVQNADFVLKNNSVNFKELSAINDGAKQSMVPSSDAGSSKVLSPSSGGQSTPWSGSPAASGTTNPPSGVTIPSNGAGSATTPGSAAPSTGSSVPASEHSVNMKDTPGKVVPSFGKGLKQSKQFQTSPQKKQQQQQGQQPALQPAQQQESVDNDALHVSARTGVRFELCFGLASSVTFLGLWIFLMTNVCYNNLTGLFWVKIFALVGTITGLFVGIYSCIEKARAARRGLTGCAFYTSIAIVGCLNLIGAYLAMTCICTCKNNPLRDGGGDLVIFILELCGSICLLSVLLVASLEQ